MNPNRAPAGAPTGGQFTASVREESVTTLDDHRVRCGDCDDCALAAVEEELSDAHFNGVHDDEPPFPGCPECDRRIAAIQDMGKAIRKGEW